MEICTDDSDVAQALAIANSVSREAFATRSGRRGTGSLIGRPQFVGASDQSNGDGPPLAKIKTLIVRGSSFRIPCYQHRAQRRIPQNEATA